MAKKSQNKEEVTKTKEATGENAGSEAQTSGQSQEPAANQVQQQAQVQAPKVTHEKPVEIDFRTGLPVEPTNQAEGKRAPAQQSDEKTQKEDHKGKVFTSGDVFQSLVGRLKTTPSGPRSKRASKFQSLVGRLKTP